MPRKPAARAPEIAAADVVARSATTTVEMERDLKQRLASLGRAHELAGADRGTSASLPMMLGPLLKALLAPYDEDGLDRNRISVVMSAFPVGEAAASTIALIVHELATNSVKYGALSRPEGTLDISGIDRGSEVVVVWTEQHGSPLLEPVCADGFGSRLIAQSISSQLHGSIAFDWGGPGVAITLHMNKQRLGR